MNGVYFRRLSAEVLILIVGLATVLSAQVNQGPAKDNWRGSFSDPIRYVQTPKITLLAGPHLTTPVGNFYKGFESAAGFGLGLRVAADDHLALRLSVRRSNLAEQEIYFIPSPEDAQTILPVSRSDADIWRFSVAAEFFTNLNSEPSDHPAHFFVYLGAGIVYNDLALQYYQFQDEADPALISGAGILFMLTPRIGMEIGSSFDLVFTGGIDGGTYVDSYRDEAYAGLFDISAALVLGLSRD